MESPKLQIQSEKIKFDGGLNIQLGTEQEIIAELKA